MLRRVPAIVLLSCWAVLAGAEAPPLPAASRGELLYSTHCIACHNEQVHWRDRKRVTDWPGLRSEVRRWGEIMSLRWNREDIDEVARYLQAVYYRNLPPE
ncbi:MAG: hypothetical protein V5B39_15620 [Accumulibacter sp.]|jgi:mono/diheme cytochrome c family protein|uniref:c-type cytochrome n=1 Tax=Accumulibacter sp. TaxID=2053492 RepID=UPI002FC3BE3A